MDIPLPPEPGGSPATTSRFARHQERWGRIPGNLRGGLWAICGSGFFAIMLALIKIIGSTMHVTEVLLFRQFFMVLITAPVIMRGFPGALMTARPGLQLIRVTVAVGAMLMGFTAVIHLPLADAITISFARTFFISIFAILILSEVVGLRRWTAMLIGFAGVLIVAQPNGVGSFNMYGVMAIAGAACAGFVMVIIRVLSRTDRPVTIVAYQAMGIGLLMIPPAIWYWRMPTATELVMLMAIGLISVISQTCNIYAFRAAEATALAPLDYMRLLYAIIIGFIIFDEVPTGRVLLGAAIIVAAGLYTLERERRAARRQMLDENVAPGAGLGGTM